MSWSCNLVRQLPVLCYHDSFESAAEQGVGLREHSWAASAKKVQPGQLQSLQEQPAACLQDRAHPVSLLQGSGTAGGVAGTDGELEGGVEGSSSLMAAPAVVCSPHCLSSEPSLHKQQLWMWFISLNFRHGKGGCQSLKEVPFTVNGDTPPKSYLSNLL